MTGTLPNLALAQRVDQNGLPASGARLFIFEANTSTPVIAYKDYALTAGMEQPHPIVADALGLVPMFWLPDGFYRARLEDRYGTPLIDEPVLPAVGTGEGGEGPGAPAAIQWSTGDFLWQPVSGVRDGWVRANGRTIGNALSGASERANADCASLFAFMWNNFDNTMCPVPGGRGASAVADFDANKVISTFDMRGFTAAGLDGMGNTLAARFADVTPIYGHADQPGAKAGANATALTEAQMPSHTHPATTAVNVELADAGHTHTYEDTFGQSGGAGNFAAGANLTNAGATKTTSNANSNLGGSGSGVSISGASGATTITATGGNAAHNTLQLTVLGSWYIRI